MISPTTERDPDIGICLNFLLQEDMNEKIIIIPNPSSSHVGYLVVQSVETPNSDNLGTFSNIARIFLIFLSDIPRSETSYALVWVFKVL